MKALAAERKKRRWSGAELARQAGINQMTVYGIESGHLNPWPGQLKKIAAALGIPEEEAPRLLEEASDE